VRCGSRILHGARCQDPDWVGLLGKLDFDARECGPLGRFLNCRYQIFAFGEARVNLRHSREDNAPTL
jgi:hypothetical protein